MKSNVQIILRPVQAHQRDTLFRLLQYSLFEESLTDLNEMNEDALFDYPWFDAYFTDPEREAYLIRQVQTEKLLGFAMIHTYTRSGQKGHSIAEFMVLPRYRRQGIGMHAAHTCFDLHDGYWEIAPAYGSERAYLFWKKAVGTYAPSEWTWSGDCFSFFRNSCDPA